MAFLSLAHATDLSFFRYSWSLHIISNLHSQIRLCCVISFSYPLSHHDQVFRITIQRSITSLKPQLLFDVVIERPNAYYRAERDGASPSDTRGGQPDLLHGRSSQARTAVSSTAELLVVAERSHGADEVRCRLDYLSLLSTVFTNPFLIMIPGSL